MALDRDVAAWWALGLTSLAQIVALDRGYRRDRRWLHVALLAAMGWVYEAECRLILDGLLYFGRLRPWVVVAVSMQLYAMVLPWSRRDALLTCASVAALARFIDQPEPSHGAARKWVRFASQLSRRHVVRSRQKTAVRPIDDVSRWLGALRASERSRARALVTAVVIGHIAIARIRPSARAIDARDARRPRT